MEAVIPLDLKVGYTLFVCALVPIYWRQYGPANFLWFSDIALLALVPALWLENALIASMMAVAVVFFEAIWNVDFFARLLTGKSSVGLSAYMFDPKIPWLTRTLSCFHIVLPLLLLWIVHRLGYDRRAFFWPTGVALVVLPLSYLVGNAEENVNWFYGFRPKTAEDSACTAVRDPFNAAVSARCLSADASFFRQNLSSGRLIKGDKAGRDHERNRLREVLQRLTGRVILV